jgi:ABC-type transport system involved in multi-copper enzyme maturation permease subunit
MSVTKSLLRKELRSIAPFFGLVLFFNALSWIFILLTEFPDQFPLSKILKPEEGGEIVPFALAFALASGLLVRERDEGTLAFLDALPVSRVRMFWVKVGLALSVLTLLPLSDFILKAAIHALSRTSLEAHFQWPLLVTGLLLDTASCFVYFSLGLALSFLRRFSLLAMGLLVCAYLLLKELQTPFVPLLNIFSLSEPIYRGQHWQIPGAKLAVQLIGACACLAIALASFVLMGDAAERFADRARRKRGAWLVAGVATVLAVIVWLGLFFIWIWRAHVSEQTEVHYSSWTVGRARTARYLFVYPENEAGAISPLLDEADRVEARVRAFLGAKPIKQIEVNMTGSAPHTAGQAHWKKVQIDLNASGRDLESLVPVLGHETTHVYMDHESQSHLGDDFNSTRFFHEGVASYVEYHLFRPPEKLPQIRRVAATMRARREVKFEELLDGTQLMRKRDLDLVYPLGEVFAAALVKRYGDAAPGRVVKAFGRSDAPKDLKGFELWQDVLQSCGYNLSDVENAFYKELDDAAAKERAFIATLPRIRGAVQKSATRIGVRATYTGKAPGKLVCRFRPRTDTPERLYEYAFSETGDLFWVDKSDYTEASLWYQLGWRVGEASQIIYEPWVETVPGN